MKRSVAFFALLVLALFAFAWSGCGSDDGDETPATCDPACTEGFTCVDGECVEETTNECDPACTEGFTCVEGQCVEQTTTECDPPCAAGFACVEGQCVEQTTTECDPACAEGFICEDGECVEETTTECDPACTEGFICVEGQCVEETTNECDPACTEGFVCVEGQCVEQPCVPDCTDKECGDDGCEGSCGDCADGSTCQEGICVVDEQTECAAQGNVMNLKYCPEGPVDVTIKGATVTYVFEAGYFLQDASGATEVYIMGDWPYDVPTVGDVVDLHVTEYGNYKNQQEVTASDSLVVVSAGNADALATDISAGTLPSEEMESMLVTGTNFTVDSADGKDLVVSYGAAENVDLRIAAPGNLCEGAVFDLAHAVVTQFEESHRIQSFSEEDFVNVDTDGCEAPADADDSNWGFEEGGPNDPPVDFQKATGGFTAEWTAEEAHTGNNGCNLTWTSQDTQDFFQGWYMPVNPGQTINFGLFGLDNDPAGRFRLCMEFYNENYLSVIKEYGNDYSSDDANWVEFNFQKEVPVGASFVRGFVRLYDVSENWDGDATVTIDDWNVTAN